MAPQDNKDRVLFFLTNADPGGDLDLLDKVADANVVRHDVNLGDVGPLADLKQLYDFWNQAFPDGRTRIDFMVAEGDRVAARFEYTGTHTGPLRMPGQSAPVQPTNAVITIIGTASFRFANDFIEEFWVDWNALSTMVALGLAKTA